MKRFLSKTLPILLLLFTLVLGLWMHQWNMGYVPLGLFSDEASIGLNAATIEQFQTDEFGHPWPIFFEAFGEYKNPIYIYATAGLLHYVPLSDVSLRGVSFLFFAAALTLWAWLLLHAFRSTWLALAGTVMLALTPWLFTLSRVSFEAISFVFLYISLLTAIFFFFDKQKGGFFRGLGVGLIAGIAWYSYTTARLLVPMTLLMSFLVYVGHAKHRTWVSTTLGFITTLIPAIYLYFHDPVVLFGRFTGLSFLYDPTLSNWDILKQFLQNYWSYFSPEFHLWFGDPNLRHHSGYGGMSTMIVYISMYAGILCALCNVSLSKRSQFKNLILLELLIAPVAASLTEPSHTIRVIHMIVPCIYIALYGVQTFRFHSANVIKILTPVLVFLILFETSGYINHTLRVYPHISVRHFLTFGLREAIHTIGEKGVTLLGVDPSIPDAEVISNYYSYVSGNPIFVTSIPESVILESSTQSFCYLKKRQPYSPMTIDERGLRIPLDVRSSLQLTCYTPTPYSPS